MSYTNSDGVYVLTGVDQGAVRTNGNNDNAMRRTMVIDLDFTQIGSSVSASSIDPMAATIPAYSVITQAILVMTTGATSGGSATLDIGTYTAAGSAVAATGITAATALTAIDAVGEVVRASGSLVSGTATVGTAPVYVLPKYNTAAYTAGAGKLYIQYITIND